MNMEINYCKYLMNFFVNVGVIVIIFLIVGKDVDEKFEWIILFMKEICDDFDIILNEEIYYFELRIGDINCFFVYYMKGN